MADTSWSIVFSTFLVVLKKKWLKKHKEEGGTVRYMIGRETISHGRAGTREQHEVANHTACAIRNQRKMNTGVWLTFFYLDPSQ